MVENDSRYKSGLMKDTYLIIGAILLLIAVEGYVVYMILYYAGSAVPSWIMIVYLVFFLLALGIESIGYWQVRHSIKQHMHEFRYYD
ncbi:MAG: monomethylamine permease [Methanosarcinaceae archaeon]|nr:monomethylamine permease [Methanosarcinaceae archaeon]